MGETPTSKLIVIAVICSVLFFLALTLLEAIPEIPVDIDFKAFFIPLAFVALLPVGAPTLAVALGAALGELLRDMLEGYEIDDPIGTIGYVVGFVLAGYVVGNRPFGKTRLIAAGAVLGLVHAVIEASSFLLFSKETMGIAIWSAVGNPITDGIIMGAIPLLFLVPRLHGRIERYMGFAPHRQDRPQPLPQAAHLTMR
jgi:hypothetical protein